MTSPIPLLPRNVTYRTVRNPVVNELEIARIHPRGRVSLGYLDGRPNLYSAPERVAAALIRNVLQLPPGRLPAQVERAAAAFIPELPWPLPADWQARGADLLGWLAEHGVPSVTVRRKPASPLPWRTVEIDIKTQKPVRCVSAHPTEAGAGRSLIRWSTDYPGRKWQVLSDPHDLRRLW